MPFGMEVGISPGEFVLDGDPSPQKGAEPPLQFYGFMWRIPKLDRRYGALPVVANCVALDSR